MIGKKPHNVCFAQLDCSNGGRWQLCKLTHQEALVLFLLLNICFGFIRLYYSYPDCFKIITYLEEHISYSSKLVTPSILDIHQFIFHSCYIRAIRG